MMDRRVGIALAAGLLILGIGAIGLAALDLSPFAGSAPNNKPEIQTKLVDGANRAGDGGTVKLADVVAGNWDTAYVWEGYGADRDHSVFPGVDFGSGAQGIDDVLAFSNQGKLEAWFRLDIHEPFIYFDLPAGGIRATRDLAVFTVTRDPNYPSGYVLRLAQ